MSEANPEAADETVVWVDGDGHVTDNPDEAVRGEILQRQSDGTTMSTLFTVDSPA